MKLSNNNFGFEGSLPGNRMGAKIKTSAKLFDVLSSGIYTDPILAPIRELSCNAWDAHVAAGCTDLQFEITVPTWIEPTFAVEDFGTGIPPEQFSDIFYTYGASTKTDSDDMIGALGLGSKSPFAYTKSSYTVRNRYDGTEYSYFCFINENGEPDGSLVAEQPTTERNGVRVEFGVKANDISVFIERIERFYRYWEGTMPLFKGHKISITKAKNSSVLSGVDWYLESSKVSKTNYATAIMGNVPYKIESDAVPNLSPELKLIATNPFVITVAMGSLDFTASREGLKYNESTSNILIQKLLFVQKDIQNSFTQRIMAAKNHVEFIQQFRKTYDEFKRSFSYNQDISKNKNVYTELLFGKNNSITFQGYSFDIDQLIDSKISFTNDIHQSFELIYAGTRGKSSRIWMNPVTTLCYKAIKDIASDEIYGPPVTGQKQHLQDFKKDEEFSMQWRESSSIRKKDKKTTDYVLNKSELFTAKTIHIIQYNAFKKIVFLINDVGSSGCNRFKLISESDQCNFFLVNFNLRKFSAAEANKELQVIINECLTGAEVKMLSDFPDLRPEINKIKNESGTMKLSFREYSIVKSVYDLHDLNGHEFKFKSDKCITWGFRFIEKVVKISDIAAKSKVFYVVKRRSRSIIFEDINSTNVSILSNRESLVSIASHYGVFDDVIDKNKIEILVVNEGQINALKKQKVNLHPIKDSIVAKIAELEATHNFTNKLESLYLYSKVELLDSFVKVLNKRTIDALKLKDSLTNFENHIVEFVNSKQQMKTLDYVESQSMAYMSNYFVGSNKNLSVGVEKIVKSITTKYPLLKYLNVNSSSIDEIMDYIKEIDKI